MKNLTHFSRRCLLSLNRIRVCMIDPANLIWLILIRPRRASLKNTFIKANRQNGKMKNKPKCKTSPKAKRQKLSLLFTFFLLFHLLWISPQNDFGLHHKITFHLLHQISQVCNRYHHSPGSH